MKKLVVLLVLFLIVIGGALIWWNNGISPVNKADTTKRTFIVQKGAGIRQISNELKAEGLIKDPVVFFLLVRQTGLEKKIQAGSFQLSPSQSAESIAKNLTIGTQDVWVTIPEGKRAEEIAQILEEAMPLYDETWIDELKANEGRLFPETYLVPKEATIETIINLLTSTFETRYATITNATTYSVDEIIIIASMIERETRHDEDRPLVSSVIHNRLEIGLPLQIDATIQYAKGKRGNTWWEPVTLEEYRSVKSIYNTYLQTGLPPGPIANPGFKALEAAANPSNTNYLYYITDENQVNRYATTVEQHEANKRRYGLSS